MTIKATQLITKYFVFIMSPYSLWVLLLGTVMLSPILNDFLFFISSLALIFLSVPSVLLIVMSSFGPDSAKKSENRIPRSDSFLLSSMYFLYCSRLKFLLCSLSVIIRKGKHLLMSMANIISDAQKNHFPMIMRNICDRLCCMDKNVTLLTKLGNKKMTTTTIAFRTV